MSRAPHFAPGRDNNFNLIRMVAAASVLVSHAFPLALGEGAAEPLEGTLGMSLGTLAVLTFFAVSGYFISQSYHAKGHFIDFAVARVLRIYPALLFAILLAVLVIGPIFTSLDAPTYFSSPRTLSYIPRNLSLAALQYDLPGVFDHNPYPKAINGSLWTLYYEVACYGMVVGVAIVGLTANARRFAAFLVVYALWYVSVVAFDLHHQILQHPSMLRNAHQLTLPFVLGMAFFQFRRYVPLRPSLLCLVLAAAVFSYGAPWFNFVFVTAWSYAVFYLGFLRYGPALVYNRLGDYSYGMYIYAFPIEQIVAAVYKGSAPSALIAVSFPATLLLAVCSWHFLEGYMLAKKSVFSARLRRCSFLGELASRW
jgi:peptidoglycan/LPS O-acetylase OafA/YrhL